MRTHQRFEVPGGAILAAALVGAANAVDAVAVRERWFDRWQNATPRDVASDDARDAFKAVRALARCVGRRVAKRAVAREDRFCRRARKRVRDSRHETRWRSRGIATNAARADAQVRLAAALPARLGLTESGAKDALHYLLPAPPEVEPQTSAHLAVHVLAEHIAASPDLRAELARLNDALSPGADPLRFVRRYCEAP